MAITDGAVGEQSQSKTQMKACVWYEHTKQLSYLGHKPKKRKHKHDSLCVWCGAKEPVEWMRHVSI